MGGRGGAVSAGGGGASRTVPACWRNVHSVRYMRHRMYVWWPPSTPNSPPPLPLPALPLVVILFCFFSGEEMDAIFNLQRGDVRGGGENGGGVGGREDGGERAGEDG